MPRSSFLGTKAVADRFAGGAGRNLCRSVRNAIRAAQAKALEFARIEMEKVTSEMGLPPGMMP